ncbi:MAG: uracil-DNA glycosylase [Spirochaetales bacterium]|jgi:DNA polymerase|nr:uracil-DNA glycosylase [Spirochaetales bacterium]
MKKLNEICTEYQNIVFDCEDVLGGGGFRRTRKNEKPKIIFARRASAQPSPSAQDNAANPGDSLEALAAEIRACRLCRLCENRTQAVPGVGVINPLVMVIGEAPGEEEDRRGEPFVGPAGRYLDKWLESVGISRAHNAYIANIVKCRPPENRDPAPEESAACMPYLLRQIQIIRPKTVLAVGRVAAQNLLQTGDGIGRLRGRPGTWRDIPFLATYHPSAVLRDQELRRPVWEDMKKLKELTGGQ